MVSHIVSHRSAGGIGSPSLFDAYEQIVEEGKVPALFAARKTLFIPTSSTVDDQGRIVRSPDALRPLDAM